MKAFRADWVCPASGPPLRNAALLVSGDRIAGVGSPVPTDAPVEDFSGCAIIPGFVNAHIHLELTLLRGFLENLAFGEWIRTLTRTRYERMDREDLVVSARLGAVECLRAGVTTVGEVMDLGTGWEAMSEAGLRGVAYQEVFGPRREDAGGRAAALEEKIGALRTVSGGTGLRRLGVSPHAPYTVSDALYRRVRDLAARMDLPVAVHIGESAAEGRFVRCGDGPFADSWKSRDIPVEARGVGPLAYLDQLGLCGARTLAIHAIDASADDIGRLRETDTAVAHCPKSNLKLGHGIAPLREFLDAGLRVGLGTDSVASNNAVDMFEEMRVAVFLQRTRLGDPRALAASEAFSLATLGGARCLGLDAEVGSLEAGKVADFVVVDLGDPALQPVYDPVEAMVFSASRHNVRATFLGGERVRVDTDDAEALVREAGARARRLAGHDPA